MKQVIVLILSTRVAKVYSSEFEDSPYKPALISLTW